MGGYEVDPERLAASGKEVGAQGDALINALDALDSALAGSGMMCGTDAMGMAFFMDYRKGGQGVISAVESAVNAFRNVGYGVEVSAHNYAVSDAVSTVGGSRESVPVPAEPTKYSASGVAGQSGAEIPEPSLWAVVEPFISRAWPNGNPDTMHTAAGAWRALGTAISGAAGDAGGCLSSVSGHDIPELMHITDALNTLTTGTSGLAGKCTSIAEMLESFAGEVQSSQDAIRDLLHRLSVSGIVSQIGRLFTGHNPIDDLKQIGRDISEILHTLSGELDATASGFQVVIDGMDGLVRKFEEWDRKEFTRFFGDQVGNKLADGVNAYADIEEGVAKSVLEVGESVPAMLAHPVDTVKGVWEIDKNLAEFFNPLGPMFDAQGQKEAGDHLLDVVKGVVDTKDWSSDRPLVGLGDNLGNIAQVLIPGVGEARAGVTAGKLGEEGAQVARAEGKVARSGLEALGKTSGEEIGGQAAKIGKDLDELGAHPLETPKAPEPTTRPAEAGPAPSTHPGDGAAAANNGAGKAPVDAGARPGGEPAPGSHGPGLAPHPGEPQAGPSHSAEPAPHNGRAEPSTGGHEPEELQAGTSQGDGPRTPVPAHASTGEAAPGSSAPHDVPAPRELAEAHSGDSHSGGHGGASPSGGDHQLTHDPGDHSSPGDSVPTTDVGHQSAALGSPTTYAPEAPAVAAELNSAFTSGHSTADLSRQVADLSTHHFGDADRVVLGKWDGQDGGYIGEARHHGGIFFDTGGDAWNAMEQGLSDAQSKVLGWQVNEQFLRTQMENHVARIEYVLPEGFSSVDEVARVRRETFSAMEINFLNDNAAKFGYQRVGNSWVYQGGK